MTVTLPALEPVHRLIEDQARLRPAALAATRGSESLDYGALNDRANRLARELRERGAGVERSVALLMDRSLDLLVALLACFKSGAAAVLLDPAHPAARTAATIAAAEPALLVSLDRLDLTAVAGAEVPVLLTDREAGLISSRAASDLDLPVHLDQLAYVVHTSGSTGEPKRVGVTHRSVAHSIRTHRDGHRIVPADRGAWLAPAGSSVSVGELWPYLASGASVHAAETATVAAPPELRDWLVDRLITKAYASMPLAELLYTLDWPADCALRLLTVGSDKVRRWASPALPFEVAVSYGSSEANGVCSGLTPAQRRLTSATADDADRAAPPPVGRAWPDVRVHVLDERMNPVPDGEVGELYVAGPELARGYLGAPGGTAERFLPDPFGVPGERIYRTGDLVLRRPDGLLEHRGRADRQIKIRGFRVEPAELETALLTLPGVADAVARAVTDAEGATVLAAYVVAGSGAALQPTRVLDAVAGLLPAALVPAVVTVLGALPLTPNGKVDRDRLPEPDWHAARQEYVAPRDELERCVAEAFADVLRRDRVSVEDNFFHLGGDSLSCSRMTARLRARIGRRVALRTVFENPTPARLAEALRATGARG